MKITNVSIESLAEGIDEVSKSIQEISGGQPQSLRTCGNPRFGSGAVQGIETPLPLSSTFGDWNTVSWAERKMEERPQKESPRKGAFFLCFSERST